MLLTFTGAWAVVFLIIFRNPDCQNPPLLPSVRLQTMESLAKAYSTSGAYHVGLKYHEGDVAYFRGSRSDWTIQLEEWRDDGRENFRVNTWIFTPHDVQHWFFTIKPNGMVVETPNHLRGRTLDVRANETAAKLVQAQKLLLGEEFDNPLPFRAFNSEPNKGGR